MFSLATLAKGNMKTGNYKAFSSLLPYRISRYTENFARPHTSRYATLVGSWQLGIRKNNNWSFHEK